MSEIMYDCVIAGSGPAGLTAAMYVARAGYSVAVVEGYGGSCSIIPNIENYPGFKSGTGEELVSTMHSQCENTGVKFYQNEVVKVAKNDAYVVLLDDDIEIYSHAFIDASGGKHRTLEIEGEEQWLENGISFCAACDGPLCSGKKVIVVGGGNSAISSAVELAKYCSEVIVVYRKKKFTRVEKPLLDAFNRLPNKYVYFDTDIHAFYGDEKCNLSSVILEHRSFYEKWHKIDNVFMVFYCIGFEPNEISIEGSIDEFYAKVGDNSSKYRQAIIAAGRGAEIALDLIEKFKLKNK